ncbi:MAG: hypothetical protein IJ181_10445 [Acidaminococcaceae bacterium]|nr:hypothetical protein [Acidaminococcaceae bacterium]
MGQIIYNLQDMTYLNWAKARNSSGTAGSFLKAYEDTPNGKIYYKLSNYDAFRGIIGHECVNEIISDRLLTLLGIEHLPYQLIHAKIHVDDKPLETWLCASRDFKQRGDTKIALDAYYQAERNPGESPLEFCIRSGWERSIYEMLVVDYLILNRDRHGANMEVLRNRYQKTVRLAPLFDHGLSFFCRCEDETALEKEDVMADKPVQCFVGSRSAEKNLQLIPAGKFPELRPLQKNGLHSLVTGLDAVIGQRWLDRILEMIWKRWQSYENFCNQRR